MEIQLIPAQHGRMCAPRFMSTFTDVREIQSAFFRIALGSLSLSTFGIAFQKPDTVARLLMEVIEWRYEKLLMEVIERRHEKYQRG